MYREAVMHLNIMCAVLYAPPRIFIKTYEFETTFVIGLFT